MQQIHPENWVVMYLGLIFLITCAMMLVVYVLSGAGNPAPGLGLYTVYFMAALLGWNEQRVQAELERYAALTRLGGEK